MSLAARFFGPLSLALLFCLAACDQGSSLPDIEDQPYFRIEVEAIFDGEPVRIDGVAHCELSKMYRHGITTSPPSVVAKLRPGLIGARLKDGAPGALFIITPRVCQHILHKGQLPTPAVGYIPLLAWYENPGESPRRQLYLYDAYHEGTESRIQFKSFAIADATPAEYETWLADYTSGPDALPLDPEADLMIKHFPDVHPIGGPGGRIACTYALRIPPEIWREDPVIVDWVESQSGDGRYWAIPLPPNEERARDSNNAYARVLIASDAYFRDDKGKWLGIEPIQYQFGPMLHPEVAGRDAFDKATLRRRFVPVTRDIWDFYMPHRLTIEGSALSPESVGTLGCEGLPSSAFPLRVRHTKRIEGLRSGDWETASGMIYDRQTDEFLRTGQGTTITYSSAY